MAQNAREKVQALTAQLNRYRDEYYNSNAPSVSDEVYDRMYDELVSLEFETGICMTDSPTRTVGYVAVSELEKTTHPIPLLSLDKTKSVEELVSFTGEHQILLMLKLDGLTVKLTYEESKDKTVDNILQMAVLYRRKVRNPGKQNGMVVFIYFAKEQVIGTDVKGRTKPDDVFRAQCFLAKFR